MATTWEVVGYVWDGEAYNLNQLGQFKSERAARRLFDSLVVSADLPQIELDKTVTYDNGYSPSETIDKKY